MSERMRFLVFYCLLGCIFATLVFNINHSKDSNMQDTLKKAFEEGYFNGRNSYIAQINDKPYQYASFVKRYDNLTNEQIKKLEEENQRGYVEGYHKATAEYSCPIY